MKPRLNVLFQNDTLLAIDKPPGLLSVPDRYNADKPSVTGLVNRDFPDARPLHRLDFETSGILLFCLSPEAFGWYSDQFERRLVSKRYLALLEGRLLRHEGLIDKPLFTKSNGVVVVSDRGKTAQTAWKARETFQHYTLVEAWPKTGRTHQIRVHFSSENHPVACDIQYGSKGPVFVSAIKGKTRYRLSKDEDEERPILSRLALHAAGITLGDHATQEPVTLASPLPRDMEATLSVLRKWQSGTR